MRTAGLSRRDLLKQLAGSWIALAGRDPLATTLLAAQTLPSVQLPARLPLSESDDMFLEELERSTFQYFVEQVNPSTGIVRDRCNVRTPDRSELGSIAAMGF